MYKDIADYGLIGDMHSLALVSNDGSIDYCSLPHLDSPTVFAALLDDEQGGYFSIRPQEDFTIEQEYLKDTNILSCRLKTQTAEAVLVDFMPVSSQDLFEQKAHIIHRCLKVSSGRMHFKLEFFPRPGYASGLPKIERKGNIFKVKFKKDIFSLTVGLSDYRIKDNSAAGLIIHFSLQENQDAHFDFIYADADKDTSQKLPCSFKETEKFWRDWLHSCVGERCSSFGEHEQMVNRSLLVLKLLTYQPTGAIAAAATTSLPEAIGSERNWDYRFTWIRDASFTLKALFALGHISEADSFIRWLHGTYQKYGSQNLQIMYSLEGKSSLREEVLGHLKGYKNSKPVRIGNNAHNQHQWDIYGEVMDTALRLSDYAGKIDETLWPFFRDICNLAVQNWQRPDKGIWEMRNGPAHFVYSKVMCWVALDRGIKIAKRYGFDAPLENWKQQRDIIKEDILKKGYDLHLGCFVQCYGSEELDASLLLLPLMNFLPLHDRRIQNTIEACKRHLMSAGFLRRYLGSDGLSGEEGAFLLCNFWLIECLALSGEIDEAKRLLLRTLNAANHLGLFSEEYDFKNKQMLGNFPQAFSHIGYINAVSSILNTQYRDFRKKRHSPLLKRMQKLIPHKVLLNKADVQYSDTPKDIATQLKVSLNNLQGAFFDVAEGRVNYVTMKKSDSYRKYVALAEKLNFFDPFSLQTDNEKKAFWINIYNILIIHGVIELDIRNSVLEVFKFFRRIGYTIAGLNFTPDDIEHGILRANRPHPLLFRRQFSAFDKRRNLCVRKLDPRIHFALVCAASSCPPIEFYDGQSIDRQLDVAGKSFINRKGLILDENDNILYLSQIFKWYQNDFGKNREELLRFILQYVAEKARDYILSSLKKISVKYLSYDWNLNQVLTS